MQTIQTLAKALSSSSPHKSNLLTSTILFPYKLPFHNAVLVLPPFPFWFLIIFSCFKHVQLSSTFYTLSDPVFSLETTLSCLWWFSLSQAVKTAKPTQLLYTRLFRDQIGK